MSSYPIDSGAHPTNSGSRIQAVTVAIFYIPLLLWYTYSIPSFLFSVNI